MFWIGSKAAIDAANAEATRRVLSPEDKITSTWSLTFETLGGLWAMRAYEDMPLPDGCEASEEVPPPLHIEEDLGSD